MLFVDVFERGHHPLGEMRRVGTHESQLHSSSGHVEGVADALGCRPRQAPADELGGDAEHQAPGVFLAGVAGEAREVFHAAVFEVFEAVEGEAGVGDHAHEGGEEAAVEGARAAFLFEDCGGGVDDAGVHVFAGYLEGNKRVKMFFGGGFGCVGLVLSS